MVDAIAPGQAEETKLLAGGFQPTEIQQWETGKRDTLTKAGFTQQEVDDYFGAKPADYSKLDNAAQATIDPLYAPGAKPATDLWSSFMAGTEMSATRLPFGRPDTYVPADAGLWQKVASTIGQGLFDLPIAIPAAIGTGIAAAETGPAAIPAASAAMVAAPELIRQTAIDLYRKGAPTSPQDILARAAGIGWETAKAAVEGAVGGKFGKMAADVLPEAAPAVGKVLADAAGFTFGSAASGSALNLRLPAAEDSVSAAILALASAATHGVFQTMNGVKVALTPAGETVRTNFETLYATTGLTPEEALRAGAASPDAKAETLAPTNDQGAVVTPTLQRYASDHGLNDPAEAPQSAAEQPQFDFHVDNPGGVWLKEKQEDAEAARAAGRNATGPLTATVRPGSDGAWPTFPVSKLLTFPGARGEEKAIRPENVAELAANMSGEGYRSDEPITVFVAHDGKAFIGEGNHRVRAAAAAGISDVPVDVRYFAGGEKAPGPLNLQDFKTSLADTTEVKAPFMKPEDVPEVHLELFRTLEGSADNAVSPAGAVGRYQIMPDTAKQYGFDPSRLQDPAYNEKVARAILADLNNKFDGNIADMAVAYNAGAGRARAWIKGGRVFSDLPIETQHYLMHAEELGAFGNEGGFESADMRAQAERQSVGLPPEMATGGSGGGGNEPPLSGEILPPEPGPRRIEGNVREEPTIEDHLNALDSAIAPEVRVTLADRLSPVRALTHVLDLELDPHARLSREIGQDQKGLTIADDFRNGIYGAQSRVLGFFKDGIITAEKVGAPTEKTGLPAIPGATHSETTVNINGEEVHFVNGQRVAKAAAPKDNLPPGTIRYTQTGKGAFLDAFKAAAKAGGNKRDFMLYWLARHVIDNANNGVKSVSDKLLTAAQAIVNDARLQKLYEVSVQAAQRTKNAVLDYSIANDLRSPAQVEAMKDANPTHLNLRRLIDPNWNPAGLPRDRSRSSDPARKQRGSERLILDPVTNELDNMRSNIAMADQNHMRLRLVDAIDAFNKANPDNPHGVAKDEAETDRIVKDLGTPDPAPGVVRLYRGEGAKTNKPFTPGSATTGRYFADDLASAKKFAADNNGRVFYIDVPKARQNELASDPARPQHWYLASEKLASEKQPYTKSHYLKAEILDEDGNRVPPAELKTQGAEPYLIAKAEQGRLGNNRIIVYRNGKPEVWQILDPNIRELLSAVGNGNADVVSNLLTGFGHLVLTGIVNDVGFMARSAAHMGLASTILAEGGHTKNALAIITGAMDMLGGGKGLAELRANGGDVSALHDVNNRYIKTDIDSIFTKASVWDNIINVVKHPLQALRTPLNFIHRAAEVGWYKQNKASSPNPVKIAMLDRRAMIDRAEHLRNPSVAALAKWVPFMEIAVKDQKQINAALNPADPMRLASTLAKGAFFLTLPTIGLTLYNAAVEKQNGIDGEHSVFNEPQWAQDLYFKIRSADGQSVVHWRKPTSLLSFIFSVVPYRLTKAMLTGNAGSFGDLLASAEAEAAPQGTPAFFTPFVETWANRKLSTGLPVVPASVENVHGWMQYGPNTTETSKAIAGFLNKMGMGWFPVVSSPYQLDNWATDWTGPLWTGLLRTLEKGVKDNKPAAEPNGPDTPFLGGFFARNWGAGQTLSDFYDAYTEYQKSRGDVSRAKAIGQPGLAPQARVLSQVNTYHQAIVNSRHAIVLAENNARLSPDEKRKAIDQMASIQYMMALRALKLMNPDYVPPAGNDAPNPVANGSQ